MAKDTLASALSNIRNAERVGKKECIVRPNSKLIRQVLTIMKDNKYIDGFDVTEDGKGGYFTIKLAGSINRCGAIKPRFSISKRNYEKFEKRYLPAASIGLIVVSTPTGLMTHQEAKSKGMGGKLIAYVY